MSGAQELRGGAPEGRVRIVCNSAVRSVILTLLVTMLTSGIAWALDPTAHLDLHDQDQPDSGTDIDAATHLFLHAGGHVQPFCLSIDLPVVAGAGCEARAVFMLAFVPEPTRAPLLRPPRDLLV